MRLNRCKRKQGRKEGVMSKTEWKKVKFDDAIADCTKLGTKIDKSLYLNEGNYPIIDQGKAKIAGYKDEKEGIFSDLPAIIFGDHTRILKYIDEPFFLGADGVKVLKTKKDNLDYKYLYYYLSKQSIPDTGYNRHFKWLKEINVAFPIPISHQRHIASTLDKANELIALRKKQLAELETLAEAVFYDMFGDPVKNEKGWAIKKLGDLGEFKNGLNYNQSDTGVTLPFLGISDFKDNRVIKNLESTISLNEMPISEYFLKNNDFVFVRSNGSKELVGRCILFTSDITNAVYSGFCIRFRLKTEMVLPKYLIQFLTNKAVKKSLFSNGRGCNISNVNQQMLSSLSILYPPLELQTRFATIIEKIDEQKAQVRKVLQESEDLFQRLMQDLFKPD
jgi:type I restriction enzyme S subunit